MIEPRVRIFAAQSGTGPATHENAAELHDAADIAPDFSTLPGDVLAIVARQIDDRSLAAFRSTCTSFRNAAADGVTRTRLRAQHLLWAGGLVTLRGTEAGVPGRESLVRTVARYIGWNEHAQRTMLRAVQAQARAAARLRPLKNRPLFERPAYGFAELPNTRHGALLNQFLRPRRGAPHAPRLLADLLEDANLLSQTQVDRIWRAVKNNLSDCDNKAVAVRLVQRLKPAAQFQAAKHILYDGDNRQRRDFFAQAESFSRKTRELLPLAAAGNYTALKPRGARPRAAAALHELHESGIPREYLGAFGAADRRKLAAAVFAEPNVFKKAGQLADMGPDAHALDATDFAHYLEEVLGLPDIPDRGYALLAAARSLFACGRSHSDEVLAARLRGLQDEAVLNLFAHGEAAKHPWAVLDELAAILPTLSEAMQDLFITRLDMTLEHWNEAAAEFVPNLPISELTLSRQRALRDVLKRHANKITHMDLALGPYVGAVEADLAADLIEAALKSGSAAALGRTIFALPKPIQLKWIRGVFQSTDPAEHAQAITCVLPTLDRIDDDVWDELLAHVTRDEHVSRTA